MYIVLVFVYEIAFLLMLWGLKRLKVSTIVKFQKTVDRSLSSNGHRHKQGKKERQ
jgi:hypothetical protein